MDAIAKAKYVRTSPRKARLVLNLIRGRDAGEAINLLRFTKKRIARDVQKVLRSAIANAEGKSETIDVDQLYVSEAYAEDGPRGRRIRPAPMGGAHPYQGRSCHIIVKVAEKAAAQAAPAS